MIIEIPKRRNIIFYHNLATGNLPLLIRVHAACVNVSRNAFFNSRSEKKNLFLWRWYCGKNKWKCGLSWSILLLPVSKHHYPFANQFFSYRFCMLSKFEEVFERKVWCVQVAHLHNAVRVLSSPSRCFQLSTKMLTKISFVIFDIVVKNKSNVV